MLYKEKLTKLPQKTSNGLIHYKQHLYTVVNNKIDKLSKQIVKGRTSTFSFRTQPYMTNQESYQRSSSI